MTKKAQKIASLVDKTLSSGIAGQLLVDRVHEALIDYVGQHSDITLDGDDCPENNPDCDPPGEDP